MGTSNHGRAGYRRRTVGYSLLWIAVHILMEQRVNFDGIRLLLYLYISIAIFVV